MHMQQQELDFFLGALSPTGFSSYYTQVVKDAETQTSALLKAGPGCGKSTLLRRIAAHLEEQGETVELIHCSSDPDSLDGVICGARKFSVVDATRRTARYINTLFHEEYITSYLIIAEYIANV